MAGELKIAVTFDDLPVAGDMPSGIVRDSVAKSIIDSLKKHNVKSPYGFINGEHVKNLPRLVSVLQSWRGAGFPVGNHGFKHLDFDTTTLKDYISNVKENELLLSELMPGENWHYWRFPYLHAGNNPSVHDQFGSFLKSEDYVVAPVSISFDDWYFNNPYVKCESSGNLQGTSNLEAAYLERSRIVLSDTRQLSLDIYHREVPLILLLHFNYFESRILTKLLDQLEGQGVKYVSLADALADPAYSSSETSANDNGISILEKAKNVKAKLAEPIPELSPILKECGQ